MAEDGLKCPHCDSVNLIFSETRKLWICGECDHKFQFKSLLTPLRIFISYGRDEYTILAKRLKEDLIRRGHEVWFDQDRLKEGGDWERYIDEGLNWVGKDPETGRIIFIMTPHSVRRPDGYCLNEIAKALTKSVPIVPVMLVYSEPPLSIYRLQYLDMQDCFPPEEKNVSYERRLDRLLLALEEKKLDFEGVQSRLLKTLQPISFTADVSKLLKDFTGRRWVFEQVDRWIHDDEGTKVFWIEGAPGAGKSAIAAWLRDNRREIAAFHFCDINSEEKRNPCKLVCSIAYQLSTQLPAYEERLRGLQLESIVQEYKEAYTYFDKLIVQPLAENFPKPDRTIAILIDALDEATCQRRNEIAEFLAQCADKTPDWMRFIVTSRPESEINTNLQHLKANIISATTDENRLDILEYLKKRLPEITGEQADIILAKSEGVFLYACLVCDEVVVDKRLTLDQLDEFPQGMVAVYTRFFNRYFGDDLKYYEKEIRPVLCLILASYEPIKLGLLLKVLGYQNRMELFDRLDKLGSLFPRSGGKDEDTVIPFHRSLSDWITVKDKSGSYYVDVQYGHQLLADYGWNLNRLEPDSLDEYFISYLCRHMIVSNRCAEACALLAELSFFPRAWEKNPLAILRHWTFFEEKEVGRILDAYRPVVENASAYEERVLKSISDLLRDASYPREELVIRKYLLTLACAKDNPIDHIAALLGLGRCERYIGKNKDALDHYLEAKTLAEETGNDAILADSFYEIADLYRENGKYKQAEESFIPIISLHREQKNWRSLVRAVRKLMLVYRNEGKYRDAINIGKDTLGIVEVQKITEAEAEIRMALCASYRVIKESDKAKIHIQESLRLIETIPKTAMNRHIMRLYGLILLEQARIYSGAEDIETAFSLRQRAYDFFEEIGDYDQMRSAILDQQNYYQFKGDLERNLSEAKRKEVLAIRSGKYLGIKEALHGVGFAHQLQYNYPEALRLYHECLKIAEEAELPTDYTRGNMADIYRFLGKFDVSIGCYEELLHESLVNGYFGRIVRCYRYMFLTCLCKGDIAEARKWSDIYKTHVLDTYNEYKEYPDTYCYFLGSYALMFTEEGYTEESKTIMENVKNNYPKLLTSKDVEIVNINTGFSLVNIYHGEHVVAEAILSKYKEYWDSISDRRQKGLYLQTVSLLRLHQGRLEEALRLCRKAHEIYTRFGLFQQGESALLLAKIYLADGDYQPARSNLLLSRERFSDYGQLHRMAESKVVEGQLVWAETGDTEKALALMREGKNTLQNMGWLRLARWADEMANRLVI